MNNNDTNVSSYVTLPSPKKIAEQIPSASVAQHVHDSRQTIMNIIDGTDPRKLLIIGPCSIHDTVAAMEYAHRLKALSDLHKDRLFIVMRTYFEKPRTITGWKGLLYDPDRDDSGDIHQGIRVVRKFLVQVNELQVPCACEFLDPNMPQYYSDLISWGAIGARTTESQVHRQLASGLSCPVGFKNSTSGSVKYPINSIKSCAEPHSFPGINMFGHACVISTRGNRYCHLVLRGSDTGPNYHMIREVSEVLTASCLPERRIMVDCSHGNSMKCHRRQVEVWREIIDSYLSEPSLIGLMVESNMLDGNCSIKDSTLPRNYGRSVTDKCISWRDTETLVDAMAVKLRSGVGN
jgi:3-deoxy-7-phosphoheptulonate synthase